VFELISQSCAVWLRKGMEDGSKDMDDFPRIGGRRVAYRVDSPDGATLVDPLFALRKGR